MQNSYYKVAVLILLFITSNAAAGNRVHFLCHGPSVAAYGRGETGTSSSDDISSSFYNPALPGDLRGTQISLSNYSLLDGSKYNFAGFFKSFKNKINISLTAINLHSGDVEIRESIDDKPSIINTNHWAYYMSAAKKIEKMDLNIGASIKYVYLDLYERKAGAAGLDLGLSKKFNGFYWMGNHSMINCGISVQNIVQPKITLISDEESFYSISRFGVSAIIPAVNRYVSYDTISILTDLCLQENTLNYYTGLEYRFFKNYIVRSGYYNEHITIGAAIVFDSFHLDYAIDFNTVENMNRIGVTYCWGRNNNRYVQPSAEKDKNNLLIEAKQTLKEKNIQKDKESNVIKTLFKSAIKDYRKKNYLKAADKFREIMLQYPEYDTAKIYYEKIENEIKKLSEADIESDLEKVSYAKGYIAYRKQKYDEAINQWEKTIQINPGRIELNDYLVFAKSYIDDMKKRTIEKDCEEKVNKIFNEGLIYFNDKKFVSCVKKMEKIIEICKQTKLQSLLECHRMAQEYISKSIKELSRLNSKNSHKEQAALSSNKQNEPEIDVKSADAKYNDGLVLYAQGKITEAIRQWEIALRLNPNHEKTLKALEKVKDELK